MDKKEKAEEIYNEMIQILGKSKYGMFDPYARKRIMPLLIGQLESQVDVKADTLLKLKTVERYFKDDTKYVNGEISEEQFNRSFENAKKLTGELVDSFSD